MSDNKDNINPRKQLLEYVELLKNSGVTYIYQNQESKRAKHTQPVIKREPVDNGEFSESPENMEYRQEDTIDMTNTENLFGLADEAEEYNTFDELREITIKCRKCGLAEGRTNVVFGEGDPNADLLFIGEGPGMHEDLQGRPFVGRAGQLLDKMIIAMGFKREQVYIANIVKCRPPGNRDPLPDEVAMCVPYLKAQINFIKPKIIVLLGAVAVRALLDSKEGITKIRGRIMDYYGVPIMPVYHPAYLLRNPAKKKEAWEDLQKVMAFLAENR